MSAVWPSRPTTTEPYPDAITTMSADQTHTTNSAKTNGPDATTLMSKPPSLPPNAVIARKWKCRVTTDGQPKVYRKAEMVSWLEESMAGREAYVVIVPTERAKRSLEANAYYWGVVIPAMADHTGHPEAVCHWILKVQFLPAMVRSTTHLLRWSFSDYVEHASAWASSFFGLTIPPPENFTMLTPPAKEAPHDEAK